MVGWRSLVRCTAYHSRLSHLPISILTKVKSVNVSLLSPQHCLILTVKLSSDNFLPTPHFYIQNFPLYITLHTGHASLIKLSFFITIKVP